MTDAVAVAHDLQAQSMSLKVYGSNTVAIRLYEAMGFQTQLTAPAPEDPSHISLFMTVQVGDVDKPRFSWST
jgi:hypothetical protein